MFGICWLFRSISDVQKKGSPSSLLTLEQNTQNGYFRRKADITSVLGGANCLKTC